MLGPIGANIISILKVLTPSEIDIHADISEKEISGAIAVGAEDQNFDHASSYLREDHADEFKNKQMTKDCEEETEAQLQTKSRFEANEAKEDNEANEAKVIPINEKVQLFDKSMFPPEQSELNSLGIYSAQQLSEHAKYLQQAKDKSKDSTSVFILKQRERLKSTRTKMIEQKAIGEYKKSSSIDIASKKMRHVKDEGDINQDKDKDENNNEQQLRDSHFKGILLNKRHY